MTPEELQTTKEKMAGAKAKLEEMLQSLTDDQWQTVVYADGDDWPVIDVVRHVAQSEKGMGRLIQAICQGHSGAPADFDRDQYNAKGIALVAELGPAELIAMIRDVREKTLALMDSLTAEDWQKKGRHGGTGTEATVAEIVQIIGWHQRTHTKDIASALGL